MNNIRELRLKRKMTQQDLGEKLGVTRVAVCNWESGVAKPRTEILPALAKVLRCKIDALFF